MRSNGRTTRVEVLGGVYKEAPGPLSVHVMVVVPAAVAVKGIDWLVEEELDVKVTEDGNVTSGAVHVTVTGKPDGGSGPTVILMVLGMFTYENAGGSTVIVPAFTTCTTAVVLIVSAYSPIGEDTANRPAKA